MVSPQPTVDLYSLNIHYIYLLCVACFLSSISNWSIRVTTSFFPVIPFNIVHVFLSYPYAYEARTGSMLFLLR